MGNGEWGDIGGVVGPVELPLPIAHSPFPAAPMPYLAAEDRYDSMPYRRCGRSGLDLPLRVIAFLEEEASGFGQMLLGSRIILGAVTDEELARSIAALPYFQENGQFIGYERYRMALRNLRPPLTESEITRERLGLEEAIRKVEAEAARRRRAVRLRRSR